MNGVARGSLTAAASGLPLAAAEEPLVAEWKARKPATDADQ